MIEIKSFEHLRELEKKHDIVLSYCTTPSCRVCQVLRPKVEALLDELELQGAYVDTTALPEIAGQRLIFAAPTIVVSLFGQEFSRLSRHFGVEELKASLERAQEIALEAAADP